jgi:hypothetical protein
VLESPLAINWRPDLLKNRPNCRPDLSKIARGRLSREGLEQVRYAHAPTPLRPHAVLQVYHNVAVRLGATDEQSALGGRLERFGLVVDTARD